MGEIINLNKARKAKAKADKQQKAQENRAAFGRTKAEKSSDQKSQEKALRDLAGKKRETKDEE